MGRCCGSNCDLSCDSGKYPKNNKCTIALAGNHVAIRKGNGDVILPTHLKSGSVPASVCPNRDSLMPDEHQLTGNYPAESFLRKCRRGETPSTDGCVSKRPRVRRGQFVGRAGNSGASSGPHPHLDTVAVDEKNGVLQKVSNIKPTNMNYGWLKAQISGFV
jgi:hypothetical protein